MTDISFIIPLDHFDSDVETYLTKALKSVVDNRNTKKTCIIFVGPSDVINRANIIFDSLESNITVKLVTNYDTDFCTQINTAVLKCTTPLFSVLEYDDTYHPRWMNEVEKYVNSAKNSAVLLPLTILQDTNGKFKSFANEIALSNFFTDEQGVISLECLEDYMDFNVTGAVIRTEVYISVGGLKKSLKIASWYEFLMRIAHNSYTIRVVPRIGYYHTIDREGSYMVKVQEDLQKGEGEWLINTAKQEYFFKEDRERVFGAAENNEDND